MYSLLLQKMNKLILSKRRKILQDQRAQEKFVEFQQLNHENSTLKKALASARGRIAELVLFHASFLSNNH